MFEHTCLKCIRYVGQIVPLTAGRLPTGCNELSVTVSFACLVVLQLSIRCWCVPGLTQNHATHAETSSYCKATVRKQPWRTWQTCLIIDNFTL
jgi:hypothetical protein